MPKTANPLVRFVPALLGLMCAALLTISLVTCSGVADRAISDWIPSDDYGERLFETYTLSTEDSSEAPDLTVTPPDWAIGVATDSASAEDPSHSFSHLTYTFDTGNVVLTYATDDIESYLEWQLNEDTIITSHLFGGRYTNIVVGNVQHTSLGGHDVAWGTYSFDNEYGRRNICFASACEVADGQVLTITSSEELPDGVTEAFFGEDSLQSVWEGVSW